MRLKKFFSMLELVVVIAILGALSLLIIPQFIDVEHDHKVALTKTQLHTIRDAFQKFAADVDFMEKNTDYFQDLVAYGLWPLMQREHPNPDKRATLNFPDYDREYRIGRKPTPYIVSTDTVIVNNFIVSVVKDPFGSPVDIILPFDGNRSGYTLAELCKFMYLRSCGANKVPDMTPENFNPDTLEPTPPANSDDILLPLFPQYRKAVTP